MVPAEQARAGRWQRDRGGGRDIEARDRDLQQLARTDLLNLHRDFGYWNPPEDAGAAPAGDSTAAPAGPEMARAACQTETTGERAALPQHRRCGRVAHRSAGHG